VHPHPSKLKFKDLCRYGNLVPVYLDLTADCETPVGAYAKLRDGGPAFLFESIVGGERISRYSFLGARPRKIFEIGPETARVAPKEGVPETVATPPDPLRLIEDEMSRYQPVHVPGMPPFTGGAVGFVGHEYIHAIEPTVKRPEARPFDLPDLYFFLTDSVVIFDHVRQTLRICVSAHAEGDPARAYDDAVDEIERIRERFRQPRPFGHGILEPAEAAAVPPGNFERPEFEAAVERARAYVRSGDIIQAVLSQRFERKFEHSPLELYRALRTVNPSPYMFLLETPGFSLVGASPEVHVRLTGEDVAIRPIAGTRPRGSSEAEDRVMETDLLADEKERAEHLMLVDLARNDIGRVCRYGTVSVPDYMAIERYSHVMHIVSQVAGRLRPDCSAYDLMRATFPAGTLSGAPKVRALQIIAELENVQRGFYGGALGYFSYEGNHDSCIGIRTGLLQGDRLYIQSGAGIVADSVASNEYQETVNKARGMLNAVALAEHVFGAPRTR